MGRPSDPVAFVNRLTVATLRWRWPVTAVECGRPYGLVRGYQGRVIRGWIDGPAARGMMTAAVRRVSRVGLALLRLLLRMGGEIIKVRVC